MLQCPSPGSAVPYGRAPTRRCRGYDHEVASASHPLETSLRDTETNRLTTKEDSFVRVAVV